MDWCFIFHAIVVFFVPMIHPTAIIHPKAELAPSVRVGPYAVIDEGVRLGADCVVGPHVYITGTTEIGPGNRFHAGCVIGDAPQDLRYHGEPTRLVIGERNTFREHVTVHRSNKVAGQTVIGSDNFLMQHTHVAHDCVLGNGVIMAGGALLAGHVTVQDRAFLSGNCAVHQFARVGTLAIVQGLTPVGVDVPPFCMAAGFNTICGLNAVGLRRAGIPAADRLELKRVYRALFRAGLSMRTAVAAARKEFSRPASMVLIEFVAECKRGVCSDLGRD